MPELSAWASRFPTHVKLSPPSPIDTIVINAWNVNLLTCDHRMMLEQTDALVEGARLIAKVVDAPNVVFGVEVNKPDAIKALQARIAKKKVFPWSPGGEMPQGSEKQLIKAALDREVPPGKLPLESGVVVQNVATAIAVYKPAAGASPDRACAHPQR